MRISDWSSDVCSSDLRGARLDHPETARGGKQGDVDEGEQRATVEIILKIGMFVARHHAHARDLALHPEQERPEQAIEAGGVRQFPYHPSGMIGGRSEAPTSELQSLMRNSNALF